MKHVSNFCSRKVWRYQRGVIRSHKSKDRHKQVFLSIRGVGVYDLWLLTTRPMPLTCLWVPLSTSGAGTAYPFGAPEFTPDFLWGSCYSIFSFICMFCRSLFVLLCFFFWPLCCLFFFDIRILIAPFVSSNSSSHFKTTTRGRGFLHLVNSTLSTPLSLFHIKSVSQHTAENWWNWRYTPIPPFFQLKHFFFHLKENFDP
jgi:hypothetical protein